MCKLRFCKFISILALFLLAATPGFGANRCVDLEGEAAIVDGDLPSAKAEAVNRAKWSAVEQVAGVEVKAQTVVQNFMLVDEAISRNVNGSVRSFKVLNQSVKDDMVTVRVNVCVEPARAKETLSGLARNDAIAVLLLAREAGGRIRDFGDSNILSETVIGMLLDRGYQVADVGALQGGDSALVDAAITAGKVSKAKNLMYKNLSKLLLLGKVDYTISARKSEDLGYGISMPFNSVKARLTYRIVSKNEADEAVVIASGTGEGIGVANSVEDAALEGLKELAQNTGPVIVEKVANHLKASTRKVLVQVSGINDLQDTFSVKELLQNIAWVTNVEEKSLGQFLVTYPENSIYLANSIVSKRNFRLEGFTPTSINLTLAR